jgi:hypothetical protein
MPVTTVTATNGQFRLTNVAIGSYSLKAEAVPFEAVVQSLTVVDALRYAGTETVGGRSPNR